MAELSLPGGATSSWEYDEWGRCTMATNPLRESQSFGYDALDRIVRVRQYDGNKVQLRYNAYDEVVYAEDVHRKVQFEYTPLGKLTARKEAGATIYFNYDTEERLVTVLNEHREAYRFNYDQRGLVERETAFDGQVRAYSRDAAGKVIKVDRPGKRHSLYEYDMAGHTTRIEHSDGSWQLFGYDAGGRLTTAINEQGAVELQYDAMGRLVKEVQDGYVVESKRDRLGRRKQVVSSLGASIQIARNEAGYVNALQAMNESGTVWEARMDYSVLGQETERWLPGGVVSSFRYDRSGHPIEHTIGTENRRQRHRIYNWNVNDRLQSMVNGLTRGQVQYGYDEFANLAWAKYEDNKLDYRMPDKAGNVYRTKEQGDRKYGAGGRLEMANGAKYSYDEEGNLTGKLTADGKKWRYAWQGNGMLKQVIRPDGDAVSFEYDALGRRTAKIYDGTITRWVWDGNRPLHEWQYKENDRPTMLIDEWGDVQQSSEEPVSRPITWLFDEGSFRPAAKLVGEEQYSIVTDYLGTPVEMFDGEGASVWSVEYDIYGKIRKQYLGDAGDCPFRYQGQYEDVETGLYYNRFRYYAPEEGRYFSQDPIGIAGGLALYAYVSDPNSLIDLFGWEDIVWRALSQTDMNNIDSGGGIVPKNPSATNTPLEHVLNGSTDGYKDQYVSLTRDKEFAERWAKKSGTRVEAIDLDEVNAKKLDLSTAEGRKAHLGDAGAALPGSDIHRGNKMARGASEVLVEGDIPRSAIVSCK